MTKNILDVKLDKLVYGGEAMGRLEDGRAVFVPYALPDEKVRVRVVEEKRGHVRAELVEVLEASPERIVPRCRHFGECGGCHYQHLDYETQLAVKRQVLVEQFQRIAGTMIRRWRRLCLLLPSGIIATRCSSRNRGWPAGIPGGALACGGGDLGMLSAGRGINALWPQLNLEPVPGLKRIELRQADNGGMLVLEGEDELPPEMELELPISAVYLSPERGPMIMAGDEFGIIEILGRPFSFNAGSFFQVNTAQAEAMVKHVLDLLPLTAETTALDVYCGVDCSVLFWRHREAVDRD